MTWKTWTVLAFALILGSTGIEAQRPQSPAQGRSGFQTLAGATARAFRVPADMGWSRKNALDRAHRLRLNVTVSSLATPKCLAASSPCIGMMPVSVMLSSVPTMRV